LDRPAIFFNPVSDRGALLRPRRPRGVELPVALFDAVSPSTARYLGIEVDDALSISEQVEL
jgi:hypothetical protein